MFEMDTYEKKNKSERYVSTLKDGGGQESVDGLTFLLVAFGYLKLGNKARRSVLCLLGVILVYCLASSLHGYLSLCPCACVLDITIHQRLRFCDVSCWLMGFSLERCK